MFSAISTLTAGVELVTELLSAAVLLMALDKLAAAVRFTYRAGRFTGWLWFSYGVPAILWAADGISWILSHIDWAEVAATVRDCLAVIVSAAVAAALVTRDAHRAWIGSIDWAIPLEPVAPVSPAVHPLALIAEDLTELSANQLRAALKTRKRTSKARLIAAGLVC